MGRSSSALVNIDIDVSTHLYNLHYLSTCCGHHWYLRQATSLIHNARPNTLLMLFRRPKFILIFVPVLLFWSAVLYYAVENSYQLKNTLSYATRPLWDTDSGPQAVVPHYYAEGMEMDGNACGLHGWNPRPESTIKVLDAVLMSSELDLLEIRMNELDAVVDNFLIVESNATFTGLPKETHFSQNRARFAKFDHKIVYRL